MPGLMLCTKHPHRSQTSAYACWARTLRQRAQRRLWVYGALDDGNGKFRSVKLWPPKVVQLGTPQTPVQVLYFYTSVRM